MVLCSVFLLSEVLFGYIKMHGVLQSPSADNKAKNTAELGDWFDHQTGD